MTNKKIKDCHAETHYQHEEECNGNAHKKRQYDDNVVAGWIIGGVCVFAYSISYVFYKIMMSIFP